MATVRAHGTWSVRDPEVPGQMVAIEKDKAYADDHSLVKAYPWAFASDAGVDAGIETTTADPGSKRRRGRPEA